MFFSPPLRGGNGSKPSLRKLLDNCAGLRVPALVLEFLLMALEFLLKHPCRNTWRVNGATRGWSYSALQVPDIQNLRVDERNPVPGDVHINPTNHEISEICYIYNILLHINMNWCRISCLLFLVAFS